MTQYVLYIQDSTGWLLKCYTVTPTAPIGPLVAGYTQVIMEDTVKYDEIVAVYNQYRRDAIFSYDPETGEVTWEIQN